MRTLARPITAKCFFSAASRSGRLSVQRRSNIASSECTREGARSRRPMGGTRARHAPAGCTISGQVGHFGARSPRPRQREQFRSTIRLERFLSARSLEGNCKSGPTRSRSRRAPVRWPGASAPRFRATLRVAQPRAEGRARLNCKSVRRAWICRKEHDATRCWRRTDSATIRA